LGCAKIPTLLLISAVLSEFPADGSILKRFEAGRDECADAVAELGVADALEVPDFFPRSCNFLFLSLFSDELTIVSRGEESFEDCIDPHRSSNIYRKLSSLSLVELSFLSPWFAVRSAE